MNESRQKSEGQGEGVIRKVKRACLTTSASSALLAPASSTPARAAASLLADIFSFRGLLLSESAYVSKSHKPK